MGIKIGSGRMSGLGKIIVIFEFLLRDGHGEDRQLDHLLVVSLFLVITEDDCLLFPILRYDPTLIVSIYFEELSESNICKHRPEIFSLYNICSSITSFILVT